MVDSATGTPITKSLGLVSHYRLLDAEHRYGHAGWDWASTARLGDDGSVEATWTADAEHPFSLRADYRWRAADTLDVTTSVVPQRDLRRFEVFLASYFQGFAAAHVRVAGCPQTGDKAGFLEAKLENGVWQMFPRDDEAVKTILDGRWQRPPNPVTWAIMPRLDVPLAMRHDVATGLTALVMAPARGLFRGVDAVRCGIASLALFLVARSRHQAGRHRHGPRAAGHRPGHLRTTRKSRFTSST